MKEIQFLFKNFMHTNSRKAFMIFLLCLFSSFGFAQIENGQVQITGNMQSNIRETDNVTTTSFDGTLQFGRFFSNELSAGLLIDYTKNKYESNLSGTTNRSGFGFGGYLRIYKSIAERFFFFAEPSFSFGSIDDSDNSLDISNFQFRVSPGFSYFFSDKISVDLLANGLYYSQEKASDAFNESVTKNYGIGLGLSNLRIGVSFLLD